MRSKVVFFRRSKVSIIFDNFDQQIETLIKSLKNIIIDFRSHDQSCAYNIFHEIESLKNIIFDFFMRSKVQKTLFSTFP